MNDHTITQAICTLGACLTSYLIGRLSVKIREKKERPKDSNSFDLKD